MKIKCLNFFSQFYGDNLGIPVHAKGFGLALKKYIPDVRLLRLFEQADRDDDLGLLTKDIDIDHPGLIFWYPNAYHKYMMFPVNIGYYIFEYTIIPPFFIENINQLDMICTASQWGVDTLRKNGVTIPCVVVPGGVSSLYNSKNKKLSKDKFTFLNVGKAEERKGTKEVIYAFNQAFKGDPNVELLLSIDNYDIPNFSSEKYFADIAAKLEYPVDNMKLIHYVKDIRSLYNIAHCAVFATRAEGIGLPITEAIACGIPTIAPIHTGTSAYISDSTAFVLREDISEPVYDKHFFPKTGQFGTWHLQSVHEIKEKMLWVYNNYEEAQKVGEYGEWWMHTYFTWELAAQWFVKNVEEVL